MCYVDFVFKLNKMILFLKNLILYEYLNLLVLNLDIFKLIIEKFVLNVCL